MGQSLVVGATGIVGGYVRQRLVQAGERPFALSRSTRQDSPEVTWFQGDMSSLAELCIPPFETLFCTANIEPLAPALRALKSASLKRVVVFTSTSILTKIDSKDETERLMLQRLAGAEQDLIAACQQLGVRWTILRPTLIYDEGRDSNVTRLARIISRYGFIPLAGQASGLRQPVHAEDLAIGALAAAESASTADRFYALPGGESLSYHAMVGRIFDGMKRPRRIIKVPLVLWRAAFAIASPLFPNANAEMGARMNKDMIFDSAPASRDFGWDPRKFHPHFEF